MLNKKITEKVYLSVYAWGKHKTSGVINQVDIDNMRLSFESGIGCVIPSMLNRMFEPGDKIEHKLKITIEVEE